MCGLWYSHLPEDTAHGAGLATLNSLQQLGALSPSCPGALVNPEAGDHLGDRRLAKLPPRFCSLKPRLFSIAVSEQDLRNSMFQIWQERCHLGKARGFSLLSSIREYIIQQTL